MKLFRFIKIIMPLPAMITMLFACKDSGSPQSMTQLFLISLNKGDLETARNISTKNTRDILKIWEKLSKDKLTEEQLRQREENFKVHIIDVKSQDDSTVIVKYSTEPRILPFDQFRLLKSLDQDGRERWKVDISTLDLDTGSAILSADSNAGAEGQQLHPQPNDSTVAPE